MKFSHLLFDLDGTLIDSKRGIFAAVHHTLDKLGVPLSSRPADLNPFIGPPLRDSFKELFNFSPSETEAAIVFYREYYSVSGLYEYDIYAGIDEALHSLSNRGFKLCVVTSKAEEYACRIIASTPFRDCFQTISGCELDGRRSTKHELINYTLDKLQLSPSKEILMVGDRYHDIRGAKLAGISSAAVQYGYGSETELKEESADLYIKSPVNLDQIQLVGL